MLIIPAIDLRGGRCVRLIQGDPAREIAVDGDPVAFARRWVAQGARWLHVVDLDGAFGGRPAQLDVVRRLAAAVPVPVQVGGGLRTLADVAAAYAAGAARVVLGTAAPALLPEAVARYGEQVAVALDVRRGKIAVQGWTQTVPRDPIALARELRAAGARRFIYTDAERDGMLAGVDAGGIGAFVAAVAAPVIAAGGVTTEADLAALAGVGVEGVIVGRALYEGRLDLAAAIRRGRVGAGQADHSLS